MSSRSRSSDPRKSIEALPVHLFVFDEDLWSNVFLKALDKRGFFSNIFRLDSQSFEDFGLGLLSYDGKNLVAACLVHWSKGISTGKRTAKFFDVRRLPPREFLLIEALKPDIKRFVCESNDSCDVGSRALSPEVWRSVRESLAVDGSWSRDIAALVERQREFARETESDAFRLFAQEKDAFLTVARSLNIDGAEFLPWTPRDTSTQRSYFSGIRTSEYRMVEMDVQRLKLHFPGSDEQFIHRGISVSHGGTRLSVVNVGSDDAEHVLGIDLYYYNGRFDSYVMLQYKAMEPAKGGKYYYYPDPQYGKEVSRMLEFQRGLPFENPAAAPHGSASHRLNGDLFFFKFCPRFVYEAHSTSMLEGIHLPVGFCEAALRDQRRIDRRVRHLSNTTFVTLLRDGWIGSRDGSSEHVRSALAEIMERSRSHGRQPVVAASFPDEG